MRLDKYLKVSRIIKRRTVAADACSGGHVTLNGKIAKPSSEVEENDILEITFGERVLKVKVLKAAEHALKADAALMYEVLSQ